MKNRSISILMFTFLTLATAANAGTLSLKECLEQADRNSPVLRTAAWDSRIAEMNLRQASATNFPRLDAQGGYTLQQNAQAAKIAGITAETQEPQYFFGELSATYTLYDFGRRDARQEQARSLFDASAYTFEARRKDSALQVIEAYFGILEAGKLILAVNDELTQVEQHRRIALALFEEGVVTRNDLLQADVRLAAARQNLLSSTNRRNNIWLRLNYLTGKDQTFRADLEEITSMASDPEQKGGDNSALVRRNELLALRKVVQAGESEVRESRSSFYPEFYTRLGLNYLQNDKVREQTILSATVGLKINLFDGFASTAGREKAVRSLSRAQDNLRQAEAQVLLEIATARNDMQVAAERVSVARSAITQSEENLRINRERYQERVGTATEVLDAQTLLTQTRTDFYRALYDQQVATARLKRATGEL